MAAVSNLSAILKHYADKQNSPFIDFREFCTYVKKYAERHVEEEAALVKYLGDSTQTVSAELAGLEEKRIAGIIDNGNKKMIVCVASFSTAYAVKYKEMLSNESIPYPVITDLPKKFPTTILEKKQIQDFIVEKINDAPEKTAALYSLEFSKDVPALIFPACVPVKVLIETAQKKIKKILKKEEFHDYFIKKLRSTNPTKEISIKGFFTHYVDTPNDKLIDFDQGDDYYLWNQTLYYVRQDFEKIQDRTMEDTNILQAVQISETHSTFLKQKFQSQQKREEALRELESNLAKAPYFYSMSQILKFQDKNGRLLYGRYSEEDLKNFFQKMTQDGASNELPQLLVFKVESGTKYYVYKAKVVQVVIRLCNEANGSIGKILEERWYKSLLNYEKTKEMTDDAAFEKTLDKLIETNSPVLYSLLNANFMTLLGMEKSEDLDTFQLFVDGKLMALSDLLMLKREKILANAKARLPLLYTIPIISWILSLINANKKNKKAKEIIEEQEEKTEEPKGKPKSKAEAIANKAKLISEELIPEGSTLDRELDYLEKQWNKMITKEGYQNLTEDVNSLIRDYTRRVINTISVQTFSRERVENLAVSLVRTPNMQKIKEEKALTEYVTLYMLRLLTNN